MKKNQKSSGRLTTPLGDVPALTALAMEYSDQARSISAFFEVVMADLSCPSNTERAPNLRGRGIAQLNLIVQEFFPATSVESLNRGARMLNSAEHLKRALERSHEQVRLFIASLAQSMWDAATRIVKEDFDQAQRWIAYRGQDYCQLTAWTHASTRHMGSQIAAHRPYPGPSIRSEFPAFWEPIVAGSGGGKFYYTMALASAMTFDVATAFVLFEGEARDDLSVFRNPDFKKFLREPNAVWLPCFQFQAIVLGSLQDDHLQRFVDECVNDMHALLGTIDTYLGVLGTSQEAERLADKEGAALRRRNAKLEESVVELRRKVEKLHNELTVVKRTKPATGQDSDALRECLALRGTLRDQESQLAKAHIRIEELTDEAAALQEFLTVVMEPDVDALPANRIPEQPQGDPATWKLVFVGGHERLHQKLRKQLRNATFLHPDQSQFSPEVFEHADAVIFSIGYCSHKLVGRAANEVRKRGLRFGYSNFTNIDIVLDEIRSVLFPAVL